MFISGQFLNVKARGTTVNTYLEVTKWRFLSDFAGLELIHHRSIVLNNRLYFTI
jgi:hypothetical protein